jgi:hypothetical protein
MFNVECSMFHLRHSSPRIVSDFGFRNSNFPPLIAVAVLSYPTLNCRAREHALHLHQLQPKDRYRFLNQNLRTISRVIIHPQFRSLGLASALVQKLCLESKTPYVEALAAMGRAHPLFQKAGMTLIPYENQHVLYYLWKRKEQP